MENAISINNNTNQETPFSPKASLTRYWKSHISNSLPIPNFLISKASPLSAVKAAFFSNLAAHNELSTYLSSFCSAANLLCSFNSANNPNNNFKHGIGFLIYSNATGPHRFLSNKMVEPEKFFRESQLKSGTIMNMPDIRDTMPERSFLPRSIVSNLPFSTSRLDQLKQLFHASHDSVAERVLVNALTECERNPNSGETKRCVGSIEDMIDFSISVLGPNVVARTTENTNGWAQSVMIGSVNRINDGNISKSVSCHQILYPYLLYCCHSLPNVRVYAADILDVQTKVKINNGIAVCHLDTSDWSPEHGAFLALKSSPGLIEVCHWIFENDMNWTVAQSQ
ncbi:polygalacturonase 1 beta-like protein 3 [Impatiens glandulifera]|uniref:polygalacturonase 1 beta-like protein 3 n=1 Tax=Impatiens glandulifera TaxID=253017 RepID=UPI001FB17B7E|nr:polygalacturonase 1 beta-like protein 3 [Impatiens glandulifera]